MRVRGDTTFDSAYEERLTEETRAAHILVNQLVGCPDFLDTAKNILASGLGASQRAEDLNAATLFNVCTTAAERDALYEGRTPSGVWLPFDDANDHDGFQNFLPGHLNPMEACDLAVAKDPTLAQAVATLRDRARGTDAETLRWKATHVSNGCPNETPVHCYSASADDSWCCPSNQVCGGGGVGSCVSTSPVAFAPATGGPQGPSFQCTNACLGQVNVCFDACKVRYHCGLNLDAADCARAVQSGELNVCQSRCNADNATCTASCR